MAPRDNSHDDAATPDPVEKGFATLATIRIGVKAMVEKNGEYRKAEILSIATRKGKPSYYVHYEEFNKRLDEWVFADRLDLDQEVEWPAPEKKKTGGNEKSKSQPPINKNKNKKSKLDREISGTPETISANLPGKAPKAPEAGGKENQETLTITELVDTPQADEDMADVVDLADAAAMAKAAPHEHISREDEIEKLRTSGSMTQNQTGTDTFPSSNTHHSSSNSNSHLRSHSPPTPTATPTATPITTPTPATRLRPHSSLPSLLPLPSHPSRTNTETHPEISRVRNLTRVQMGQFEIEPWYFSPYPAEFSDADIVYICEFCLGYYDELKPFERHRSKCQLVHPPGNEIYRDDYISFFEIDGRRQRTWCRNLCLLSKLFLDHKTLYYDVDPFLFYCMCTRDDHGCHLVGYFSKEKDSAEGYNLACILTLPQYQRKGFGRLLIAFSYELSKRENKLGSPEKPLSDLGLLGYRAYWQETLVDLLMEAKSEISVEELGAQSAMTTSDVLHTLQNLNLLRYSVRSFDNDNTSIYSYPSQQKNSHVILLTDAVIKQREKQKEKEKIKGKHHIDASKLIWKPPVFTASARTWNW